MLMGIYYLLITVSTLYVPNVSYFITDLILTPSEFYGLFTGFNGIISLIFLYISLNWLYKLRFNLSFLYGIIGIFLTFINYIYSLLYLNSQLPVALVPIHINLLYGIILSGLSVINISILMLQLRFKKKDKILIKMKLLDLGTKFYSLETRDIAEKCLVNSGKVKKIVQTMIKDKEIYASYVESSGIITFDQDKNIENFDDLLTLYQQWEKKEYKKIEKYS